MAKICKIIKKGYYYRVIERKGGYWKLHKPLFKSRTAANNYKYKLYFS